jgi:hypothetical protein
MRGRASIILITTANPPRIDRFGHGAAIPEVTGQYFYSDYCAGFSRA